MNACSGAPISRWRGLVLCGLLLASSACRPLILSFSAQPAAAEAGSSITYTVPEKSSSEINNAAPEEPSQEATQFAPMPATAIPQVELPTSTATPAVSEESAPLAPLRFAFPTQESSPGSAWRPALYPIPWALTPFDHFYFARPIAADDVNWPLADYRFGGVFFEDVVHSGVDIPVDIGTPVLAAGPGEVTWTGYGLNSGVYDENDPYGLAVYLRHDFGHNGYSLYTVYAHLSRIDAVKGQHLETGAVLGASGQTGKATGPHVHFEVRLEKDDVFSMRNPELWLVPPQGWGVLAGRVMNGGGGRLEGHLVTVRSVETGYIWRANTYTGLAASDEFYRENVVISDLPAGRYEIVINYWGKNYSQEIQILPGQVSTFSLRGQSGFTSEPLPLPGADFSP